MSPSPSSLTARLGVLFAALVLVLAACAGGAASPAPTASPLAAVPTATAAPTATPAPTPSPTPAPAFPATLTDDEGTAVTLAAEPTKIVSLTPAVTETLFAVGAGDRVVATDDSSDYPAEAKPLPDVVTFGTVDVEKIVGLGPRPRHRRWRRVHLRRIDRPAARAQDPGPGRLHPVDRRHLQGHRARRERRRRGRCRDRHHDEDAGGHDRHRHGRRGGVGEDRRSRRGSSTTSATSTRPARSTDQARDPSSPRWSGCSGST